VRHRLVRGGNAPRTGFVYFGVSGLSAEGDAGITGVSLGDGDDAGVWPGRALNNWRTR